MTGTVPQPGIYANVPFEEYLGWDAASNSALKMLDKSPLHLKQFRSEQPSTKAMRIGRASHSVVLEPDKFDDQYAIAGQCTAITGKLVQCVNPGVVETDEGWRCGHAAHQKDRTPLAMTRTVLPMDDYTASVGIQKAVWSMTTSRLLLTETPEDIALCNGPSRELSLVWVDPTTGVLCKARPDKLSARFGGCIADLKSTEDASKLAFQRSIDNYKYYRQAALYLAGAKVCGLDVEGFAFIAVEKKAPYAAAFYELDAGALDAGETENGNLLQTYARCLETDVWPGYKDEVQTLSLPPYAWTRVDEGDTRHKMEFGGELTP